MVDKKKLKEQYKNTKSDMGVFMVKSNRERTCFIQESGDLKSAMNGARFQLDFGSFHNQELQTAWKRDGALAFTLEILEILPYDDYESKVDYSEELEILKAIWEERLAGSGMTFFKK